VACASEKSKKYIQARPNPHHHANVATSEGTSDLRNTTEIHIYILKILDKTLIIFKTDIRFIFVNSFFFTSPASAAEATALAARSRSCAAGRREIVGGGAMSA
jgi:hypothetical protein